MNFKENQKVICISDTGAWQYGETKESVPGPKKNQVCTIRKVEILENTTYLKLEGFDHGIYNARPFRPFEETKSALKELTTNFKETEETTDIPVKILEEIK